MRHVTPWWVETPIAHRGLHDADAVENSVPAFEAAVAAGYPIELDVRAARDGAVVFHDATLVRMTGREGCVAEATLDQLRGLTLRGTQARIPTLAEVLDAVAGRVPLLVELKNGGAPGALEAEVAHRLGTYRGEAAVQSFNPRSVAWFARHDPHRDRGLLAADFADSSLPPYQRIVLRRLGLLPWCRPHFVGYELGALPYWATDAARRGGRPLLAWTIRTVAQLRRARRLADNVIFEHVRPGRE